MIPVTDHGQLSPSGRVSKRAREAALTRTAAILFPADIWDDPKLTDAQKAAQEAQALRLRAANLRDLAARGMCSRKYAKAAAQLEKDAAFFEGAR